MEIKVGDFIRSNDGYIAKIIKIQKGKRECDTYYCTDKIMASGFYEHIKKHSKKIIDLIEEGDYVNGQKIKRINDYGDFKRADFNLDYDDCDAVYEDNIKSIVTKEQFSQMEYNLEE